MVILWTDALIYFLLAVIGIFGFYLRDKVHIKRPLYQLGNSVTAMVSLVVLMFFLVIGLLDSIHYKSVTNPNHDIVSLLDEMLTPLREHNEKTYSAPLSAFLYSKEMMALPDGSQQWNYPRLSFGGAHLQNPAEERVTDVAIKAVVGLTGGAVLVFLLMLLCGLLFKAKRQQLFGRQSALAVWFSVLVLTALSCCLMYLSLFYHVFGTDKVGEDVFYQTLKSIRTGLVIGTLTTLVMLPMAISFGIVAGYFRGWLDDIIQYLYTTLNSIPSVLLIAASILTVQVYMANHEQAYTSVLVRSDTRLLFLCLILGITSWTGLCRLLRAETLKLREMEYVQAAQALGVTHITILWRHILPNVMHIVLISVVLDFSALVLAEAVLSYINIGVDPTTYSWGNMINGARLEMAREPVVWWSLAASFIFMFTLVLAANLFADKVRDAFDPRQAQR
ncbi:MAG: ABC transporter permease [Methylococcaceae bacterium]|jgi:peptide/nickel transport system permease protein